jgi:hypothetical protein
MKMPLDGKEGGALPGMPAARKTMPHALWIVKSTLWAELLSDCSCRCWGGIWEAAMPKIILSLVLVAAICYLIYRLLVYSGVIGM